MQILSLVSIIYFRHLVFTRMRHIFAATLARVGSVDTLASVKQGPPTNLPPYLWGHISAMTNHMPSANLYAVRSKNQYAIN